MNAVVIGLGVLVDHTDDFGPVGGWFEAKLIVDAHVEVEFVVEARQGCVLYLRVVVGILKVDAVLLEVIEVTRQFVKVARAP